ncbi:uncharacterized protein LOC143041353 [Oratosquilla oratoria]|uniref:uncharacterized protein LOC143041353 n=1 Tax=Oratosquilla oratoria TaxID=337810 RepID=UPI003F75969D
MAAVMTSRRVLAMILLLVRPGAGEVMCYQCVWSSPGVRASEIVRDACRPGSLDTNVARVESCANGCKTVTMYEKGPHIDWDDANDTQGIMTFYSRICAQRNVVRQDCEVSEVVGIRSVECFCSSNYCNAAPSSGGAFSSFLGIVLIPLGLWSFRYPGWPFSSSSSPSVYGLVLGAAVAWGVHLMSVSNSGALARI